MWTTELNSIERSKKRKTGPPCYFLNHCFPIFLSAVGCPWLNSEVCCSCIDVTPLISNKLAVIRATPVEWFDLSPDWADWGANSRISPQGRVMSCSAFCPSVSSHAARAQPAAKWHTGLWVQRSPSPASGDPLTSGIWELLGECSSTPFFRHTVLKGVPFTS